ncbi:MAG: hypothetical protein ACI8WB_001918 [Phenylobacterium sp.]|jgi:hypothetical protein
MYVQQQNAKKNKSRSHVAIQKKGNKQGLNFVDNRPQAIAQRKLQEMANNSPREHPIIQKQDNNTGLPDNLKAGMENLSGMSLDHVKVHRNSAKPAAVQAHAYAQGSDIHLASGQESHLPHELGHVVQQAQGRVQPTTSVDGVAVNDNAGLEDEATAMGAKALQRASVDGGQNVRPDQRLPTQPVTQYKLEITDKEKLGELYQALVEFGDELKKVQTEKSKPKIDTPLIKEQIIKGLGLLEGSKVDYGEINPEDSQHIAVLYFNIRKQLGLTPDEAAEKEQVEQVKQDKQEEAYKDLKKETGNESETYITAILGAGASAAYYLESNKGSYDKSKTIVIGELQPWAGQRGTDGADGKPMHVNHPMHMISTDRSKMNSGNEKLATRAEFSKDIQQGLEQNVAKMVKARVTKVNKPKDSETFYTIEAGGVIYFAQHVVVAMGTGKHIESADKKTVNDAFFAEDKEQLDQKPDLQQDTKPIPRVMNLDEFQHNATRIADKGAQTVFISGGNAAIDAVTRIIRENETNKHPPIKLIWAQGSRGAAFLTGTDNEETRDKYKSHLDNDEAAFKARTGKVTKKGDKVEIERTVPEGEDKKTYLADYYVHGQGQDAGSIMDLFTAGEQDQPQRNDFVNSLTPTEDPNRNFDEHLVAGEDNEYKDLKTISGYELPKDESSKHSLKFIGATASKLADARAGSANRELDKLKKVEVLNKTQEERIKVLTVLSKEPEDMKRGINYLPQNVLSQEQLAPVRAAQESQAGFMPKYIGEEANFAVDNKTAIRIHILLKYPDIEPETADICAQIIVGERLPDEKFKKMYPNLVGPIPNPSETQVRENAVTFSAAVKAWLAEIEQEGR